jgi:hypothetical protein
VKSSRADWLADSKRERYLPHCTHFSFIASAGLIARWELDRDIGLIECGHPALERMLANRRDEEWLALVETIAFARAVRDVPETSFFDGAGI